MPLYGDYLRARDHQLGGEGAVSSADIEHQLTGPYVGRVDDAPRPVVSETVPSP